MPIFAWMLLSHPEQPWWRFCTAVIFSVAILTDTLDGYLARKHNIITRFGKLADPIADKALTGMAFIGLSIIDELPWWVTITILVREWGITIMRFVVLRYGVMAAGRGGKIKTVTQAIAVILYLLPLPGPAHVVAMIVMAVAWLITMVTGLDYIRDGAQPAASRPRPVKASALAARHPRRAASPRSDARHRRVADRRNDRRAADRRTRGVGELSGRCDQLRNPSQGDACRGGSYDAG